MNEERSDKLTGRQAIIAVGRSARPHDFADESKNIKIDPKKCPFCYGNESKTPPEIWRYPKNDLEWWVRVVPNLYPATENHEVIIESSYRLNTHTRLEQVHESQIERILHTYQKRIKDLEEKSELEYISVFRNWGERAGASLHHPHSQLIGLEKIPWKRLKELKNAEKYYNKLDNCVYCSRIEEVIKSGERLILENDHYISMTPYVSCFRYETWIMPKEHISSFKSINKRQRKDLANVLKDTIERLNIMAPNLPYNICLIDAPTEKGKKSLGIDVNKVHHWRIEIIPRLATPAGFEFGTGKKINLTSPEDAAKFLREIK